MQLTTKESQDYISGGTEMSSCLTNVHLYLYYLNTVKFS